MAETIDALVVGAGPAGLMAAEELAKCGHSVIVVEAKATIGRKFLMAGKSGLNLTKAEAFELFLTRFGASSARLEPILSQFDPQAVQEWAAGLEQEVFTGTTGRVFPKAMKASPLLRAWSTRLQEQGVSFRTAWKWLGWNGDDLTFDTRDGLVALRPKVTVLALGGASWSRLGSTGEWLSHVQEKGVKTVPFAASNAGLVVEWSNHMERHFGAPVKGIALKSNGATERGEFTISKRGLEGGGIYSVSAHVRENHALTLDLLPDQTPENVTKQLNIPRRKVSLTNYLRKVLKLDKAKIALLQEFAHPLSEQSNLAELVKNLPIKHQGLRPIDEAISTVGGVSWDAVDDTLMLTQLTSYFVAGEMLDWDAPTGGYLITGCMATGRFAGINAANWLAKPT